MAQFPLSKGDDQTNMLEWCHPDSTQQGHLYDYLTYKGLRLETYIGTLAAAVLCGILSGLSKAKDVGVPSFAGCRVALNGATNTPLKLWY